MVPHVWPCVEYEDELMKIGKDVAFEGLVTVLQVAMCPGHFTKRMSLWPSG